MQNLQVQDTLEQHQSGQADELANELIDSEARLLAEYDSGRDFYQPGQPPLYPDLLRYIGKHFFIDRLAQREHDNLDTTLEDISDSVDGDTTEPICTVTIPVAVLREEPSVVANTVQMIADSQPKDSGPVEVVIWANASYGTEEEEIEARQAALHKYDLMKEALKETRNSKFRIRTALEVLPKNKARMVDIRANYMDVVIKDAIDRGFGFDHPVMWVDADTTFVSKNIISNVSQAVRNFDGFFVHTNTQYSIEGAKGKPLEELDAESKAVAIREIQRRQSFRQYPDSSSIDMSSSRFSGKDDIFVGGYPEESGLAFALGTYIFASGARPFIGSGGRVCSGMESMGLIKRFREEGLRELERYENWHDTNNWWLTKNRNRLWLLIDDTRHPVLKYIKSAKMGTSARRHYDLAVSKGARGLIDPDMTGYDGLYSQSGKSDKESPTNSISASDMRDMLDKSAAVLARKTGAIDSSDRQKANRRVLDRLVNKYFE